MLIKTVVHILLALVGATCAEEYNIYFSNYYITNSSAITKVSSEGAKNGYKYTKEYIDLIESSALFKEEYVVRSLMGRLSVNTLRPIPYVNKDGGQYVICYSEYNEGLQCEMDVQEYDGFIHLSGAYRCYSLCQRKKFEPFPSLVGGEPSIVIGGQNKSGILVYNGESSVGAYGLLRKANGATALSIMLVRYELDKEKGRAME